MNKVKMDPIPERKTTVRTLAKASLSVLMYSKL